MTFHSDVLFLNQSGHRFWGFADLHTHPAVHLAFGSTRGEDNGVVWGKPGWRHDTANIAQDLPDCDGHNLGLPSNIVGFMTRGEVLKELHSPPAQKHGNKGWPLYSDWPAAKSRTHQQMHITWIHRAWRAGLRILVASAVDNHLFCTLWHRFYGAGRPVISTDFDKNSAIIQLNFIQDYVRANKSWMTIVRNSAELYQSLKAGKLAVILGLEMDQLTVRQILDLVRDYHVRLVTPIHLTDNRVGGVAVYDELFNTLNFFLTGQFISVKDDSEIEFRFLPNSTYMHYVTFSENMIEYGALKPATTVNQTYPVPDGVHGHRNSLGLRSTEGMKKLMRAGLMIDLAHMSQISMEETVEIAELYGYPLLNTHTNLRPASGKADSERQMLRDHAKRIGKLGGIIGLGTSGQSDARPVEAWLKRYDDVMNTTGQPVALGTDFNGLELQIDWSEVQANDSFTIPSDSIRSSHSKQYFHPVVLGGKVFNFKHDGLAHYGMLPEFVHALSTLQPNGSSIRALYSSAYTVYRMWQRIEAAQQRVD